MGADWDHAQHAVTFWIALSEWDLVVLAAFFVGHLCQFWDWWGWHRANREYQRRLSEIKPP
jgi:hypothetical protein